jgi:5,10-methylene-tetrahydrofolate dehydrogenase/methenyl tetrahydrofolate cyclohydrolase
MKWSWLKAAFAHFFRSICEGELMDRIDELNADRTVHGIIVQVRLRCNSFCLVVF